MSQSSNPLALFDLDDRVAVVTGGGRGLGRSIAAALAAHGAHVVLAGRNEETLEQAKLEFADQGWLASYRQANIADEISVNRLCSWVEATLGHVDILVNNAGINPYYEAPEEVSLAHWQEVIATNLTGVFLCCRAFGAIMLGAGRGSIINISSIAGQVGLPKTTPYCAAKGGVEQMSRSMALDWARRGVRVNCIAPGYFETELTREVREHTVLSQRLLARTPMGRFGKPDEIAGAAVFLASDASSYVTGETLLVDGGWVAG